MASREWAIRILENGEESDKRAHIKIVAAYYQQLSEAAQKKFDAKIKTSFKCEFCPLQLTACSIGKQNKYSAYFKPGNKNEISNCCTGDCKLYYDEIIDGPTIKVPFITTSSDPSLLIEIKNIDELSFLEPTVTTSATDAGNVKQKIRKNKGSSTAHTVGSVVKCFLQKREGYDPLTVPHVNKRANTYGTVFQPLKKDDEEIFCGWHIFYGELATEKPLVENADILTFNLNTTHLDQPIRLSIDRKSSLWSNQKIDAVKRALNATADEVEKGNSIHVFVLAKPAASDNGLFWVIDYPYFYLFASPSFVLPSANWGIRENKAITQQITQPVTEVSHESPPMVKQPQAEKLENTVKPPLQSKIAENTIPTLPPAQSQKKPKVSAIRRITSMLNNWANFFR